MGMERHIMKALFIILTIGLLAPIAANAETQKIFVSQTPMPRVDYWQKRVDEIDQQLASTDSLKGVKILFVGDSITDFWHLDANPWFPGKFCGRAVWDESFGPNASTRAALNFGVSGDRIEHVLYRLTPKAKGGEGWLDRPDLQPEWIFVMLGINNSFDAEQPVVASITEGVEATIMLIHERRPNAKIVVQSLLPTDDDVKNRDLVQPVNLNLHRFTQQTRGLRYLDLYGAFVDEKGSQKRALFNDSLHPSREGYRLWRDRLVAFIDTAH